MHYTSFYQRIWFTVIFFLSKRAIFYSKYEFSLLNCYIFCRSSCYHGQDYQNVLQLFWGRITTRLFVLVYYFSYIPQSIRSGFFRNLFWCWKLFHIILKFCFGKAAKNYFNILQKWYLICRSIVLSIS